LISWELISLEVDLKGVDLVGVNNLCMCVYMYVSVFWSFC